jgi:hypothetical protein
MEPGGKMVIILAARPRYSKGTSSGNGTTMAFFFLKRRSRCCPIPWQKEAFVLMGKHHVYDELT